MTTRIDPEAILIEEQRLAALAAGAIERAMDSAGLNQARIAERLDVSAAHVCQVLDGTRNMTLRTFAAFGLACGVRWTLRQCPPVKLPLFTTEPTMADALVASTAASRGPLKGAAAALCTQEFSLN